MNLPILTISMYKKLGLIFLLTTPFVIFSSVSEVKDDFKFNEQQVSLASEIIETLEINHLIKKDYASIRDNAFEVFTKRLDPNKTIFTNAEVTHFHQRVKESEGINNDLGLAFDFFNLYSDRYHARYKMQVNFLGQAQEISFNTDRTLLRDLSENKRQNSIVELEKLWIDLSTNDVIQLMLSGNDLEKAADKTIKRMDNQLNYFAQTRNEDVFNIFINSIASIYGPHTNYMSPKNSEDFDINMSLSLEGIGALLSSDGLYTSISSLVPGGPAEKTEMLKPKDKIVGVGQEQEGEIIDVIGWRIDDVVELIRGPKGSTVRLEVIPSTSLDETETKEIKIVRNIVKLEDQAAEKKVLSLKRNNKDYYR